MLPGQNKRAGDVKGVFGTFGRGYYSAVVGCRASGIGIAAHATRAEADGRWSGDGRRKSTANTRTQTGGLCSLASGRVGTAIRNEGRVKEIQKAKSSWLMKLGGLHMPRLDTLLLGCLALPRGQEIVGREGRGERREHEGGLDRCGCGVRQVEIQWKHSAGPPRAAWKSLTQRFEIHQSGPGSEIRGRERGTTGLGVRSRHQPSRDFAASLLHAQFPTLPSPDGIGRKKKKKREGKSQRRKSIHCLRCP